MNRLLAIKLTNRITKWANSRNLLIESSLQNCKRPLDDKVTYCNGSVIIRTLNIELYFNTKDYYKHNTLSVRGWHDEIPTIRTAAHIIFLEELDDTLDHIVDQISDQMCITHDGLQDLSLTGLPDLEHNPILATYLSDAPNKCNDTWSYYRDKISNLLALQGVDESMHPNGTYADGNFTGYQLWNLLHSQMCGDAELGHTYYHALIAYHQPLPSETVSGCLTYYQDDRKRQAGIRTPIKIRKYLDKFFREVFDEDKLYKDKEFVVERATDLLTQLDELDVRIYDDSDYDGWAEAYASEKISSCMNTTFKNYGVGTHKTFRCYLTSHFTGGDFSSGLSLAVLYNKDIPVARSIVYEHNGQNYFVRVYADNRLTNWLEKQGYRHSGHIPVGTHLYTEYLVDGEYICPYVDGDSDDAKARFENINGYNLWVIDPDGEHSLQVTSGALDAGHTNIMCEHCDARRVEHEDIPNLENGGTTDLCELCYEVHVYCVDQDWQYHPYIYSDSSLVRCHNGEWYSKEYLFNSDQVEVDGHLESRDDCFYCPFSERWLLKVDDGIYLGDAPDFVQTSWINCLGEGYVSQDAYNRCGLELGYYSDYLVHEGYAKMVVLGDAFTHLADAHIKEYVATKLGEPIVMPHSELAEYDKDLYKALVDQANSALTDPTPSIICDHVFG